LLREIRNQHSTCCDILSTKDCTRSLRGRI